MLVRGKAYIVLKEGYRLTEEEIIKFCEKRLAAEIVTPEVISIPNWLQASKENLLAQVW